MTLFASLTLADGLIVLFDIKHHSLICRYDWYPHFRRRSWYAAATVIKNGKPKTIFMHRLLAKTPPGEVCHHINRISLDNRFENLQNMSRRAHKLEHLNNPFKVVADLKSSGKAL